MVTKSIHLTHTKPSCKEPGEQSWTSKNLRYNSQKNRLNLQKDHLYECGVVFIFRVILWLEWAQAQWRMMLKHLPYVPLPLDMPWECWHENRKSAVFTRTPRQVSHGGSLTFRRPGKWPVCAQHVHPVYACIQVHQIYYACVDHLIYCRGLLPGAAGQQHVQNMLDLLHVHGTSASTNNRLSYWAFLGGNTWTILRLLDSLWFCTCLQAETQFWDNINATTLAYF